MTRSIRIMLLTMVSVLLPVFINAAFFTPTDGDFSGIGLSAEQLAQIAAQMQEIADNYNQKDSIKLAGHQEKFADANNKANASTLLNGSPHSNTGISSFSFGIASSSGIVNPGGIQDMIGDLNDGNDSDSGVAANGLTLYGSLNGSLISSSLLKDFIFDFKAGYFKADQLVAKELDFSSFMIGGGLRYRIFKPKISTKNYSVLPITIGAGVYQVNSGINVTVDDISHSSTDALTQISTEATTDLEFKISNSTTTFPVEFICPVKVYTYFNFFAGTGFDLIYGETSISLKADSDVKISHSSIPLVPLQLPDLVLQDDETVKNSDVFRYKLMFGGGFTIGAANVNIPVTWYPADNNFALSILAGVSF